MRLVTLPILLFSYASLFAQTQELSTLKQEFDSAYLQRRDRVRNYLSMHNKPSRFTDSEGNIIELIDVTSDGEPVYISTFNAGLALTTGVTKLRENGGLGLNLTGQGMTVGIWDGGPVFQHDEFDVRANFIEGGTISDHATHVTGTVLAKGLFQDARGMASSTRFYSYEWNNDRAEMVTLAKPDHTGLLFSNHSYGIVQGWVFQNNGWTWTGNSTISTTEDWRFGFYTTTARDLDLVAFNAPYYSIFWAAGNDRDDTGGAVFPPDGNQGSGYDCLAQEGTAKNIFTIGAIRKIPEYVDGSSVMMSTFSNWGPTDDGRIKPDLVAPGVGIISTVSSNTYASYNGTSMASPGAMGSLLLVQQLFMKLNGGIPMRSATLKALAIHTAKEAGDHPGPDYSYGWGVVDVEAASKHLLATDGSIALVEELELSQGQKLVKEISPRLNSKVTITIAWTDPAGSVPLASLDPTNLILVNDLDARVNFASDEVGLPWTLNPDVAMLGQPAFKADNFRDNVEKIEYVVTNNGQHQIEISHKGELRGSSQQFSLIVTYEPTVPQDPTFYWVGGSGEWSDPAHWSQQSGGSGGTDVPGAGNKVVFDSQSGTEGDQITLSGNVEVNSLMWLNEHLTTLNFQNANITIHGDAIFGESSINCIGDGEIHIDSENDTRLTFVSNNLGNLTLLLEGSSSVHIDGDVTLNNLSVGALECNFRGDSLKLRSLHLLSQQSKLNLYDATVELTEIDQNPGSSLLTNGTTFVIEEDSHFNFTETQIQGTIVVNQGILEILGNNIIDAIEVNSTLNIQGNNGIGSLTMKNGSSLNLQDGSVQELNGIISLLSTSDAPISIISEDGLAILSLVNREKMCFDYLHIKNIKIEGEAVVNAGLNSLIEGSINWESDLCENVLFPDFLISERNCTNGLMTITDNSNGLYSTVEWTVPDALEIKKNENELLLLSTDQIGAYTITLTISLQGKSRAVSKEIDVLQNDIQANTVIVNGNNLFSMGVSDTYQWYKDFSPIPGAVQRTYAFNGDPGLYFVLNNSESCNRISSEIIINSVSETKLEESFFWPNPTDDGMLNFSEDVHSVRIMNGNGALFFSQQIINGRLQIESLAFGVYIIEMRMKEGNTVRNKLIVK